MFVCGMRYQEEDFMIRDNDEVRTLHQSLLTWSRTNGPPPAILTVCAASQAELLPEDYPLLEERVQVLEREQVELINVPVPEFEDGDPADIVHDFQRVRRLPLTMLFFLLDRKQ